MTLYVTSFLPPQERPMSWTIPCPKSATKLTKPSSGAPWLGCPSGAPGKRTHSWRWPKRLANATVQAALRVETEPCRVAGFCTGHQTEPQSSAPSSRVRRTQQEILKGKPHLLLPAPRRCRARAPPGTKSGTLWFTSQLARANAHRRNQSK